MPTAPRLTLPFRTRPPAGAAGGNVTTKGYTAPLSFLQLVRGEAIYGANCGPAVTANYWIDDLDKCCFDHDACWVRQNAMGAAGNPKYLINFRIPYTTITITRGGPYFCSCDRTLVACADQRRADCDRKRGLDWIKCRASVLYSKAGDISTAFSLLMSYNKC